MIYYQTTPPFSRAFHHFSLSLSLYAYDPLMAVSLRTSFWDSVVELTKVSQKKGSDPLLWAIQLSSHLNSAGVCLPSSELANLLVSHICWDNNVPIAWKFLEKALMFKILPPFLVLALLSTRVIPNRRTRPAAFRLYMELLKRHAFKVKAHIEFSNYEVIMNSIDNVLRLSEIFGLQASEPGILVVEFIFSIVWQLLEASLEDEGLLELTGEKKSRWASLEDEGLLELTGELGGCNSYDEKIEHQDVLQSGNTVMAVELIGQFLQNKVTSRILYLARRNMPTHWNGFVQQIELLVVNSSALRNSKVMTHEVLIQLISDNRKVLPRECKTSYPQDIHAVIFSSAGLCHGTSCSTLWLPLDLVLEDAMDGLQVTMTSAIETITGLIKALQAFNGATWHETFLGLWMAALRLVQRERDPIEGPVPRLDTRLCMLLCITTLVVADLIEEEESTSKDEIDCDTRNDCKEQVPWKSRGDLISSLQSLGDYQSLLTPPQSVITAANQAAAKAMMFISGINVGNAYFESISMKEMPINCSGNLHHLIVEACMARNLLDTSAYFWPNYVNGQINQIPHSMPCQGPGWLSFMKGGPLTPLMINALVSTPASSQG